MTPSKLLAFIALSFTLFISSCSLEEEPETLSKPAPATNTPPVVDAGANRAVYGDSNVSLIAIADDSDGTVVSYSWTQLAGPLVTLSGIGEANLSFTAPEVEAQQVLIFQITVTDNKGEVAVDTIDVNVFPNTPLETPSPTPPSVNAGANQTVSEQELVTLSALADDQDGIIASFQWSQISGYPVELSARDQATLSFYAPAIDSQESLVFSLTVTDNEGNTNSDSIVITVVPNAPPVIHAGANQSVREKSAVLLAAISEDGDGKVVSYRWVQTLGQRVELNPEDSANTSFTAPSVNVEQQLIFAVTATDNDGDIATDSITVTVRPNEEPTVIAIAKQTVSENDFVSLSASAEDGDGNVASYSWEQVSGTTVKLKLANTANASFVAPAISSQETLKFKVTVTDNDGDISVDTTEVVVLPNGMPSVDAGANQVVSEKTLVSLLASASDSDGVIESYQWVQLTGSLVDLASTDSASTSFVAPAVDDQEVLTFKVNVRDDDGDSVSDTLSITVNANLPPTVDAGVNQSAQEYALVSLSALAKDSDGSVVDYSWSQVSGPSVEFTSLKTAATSFKVPEIDAQETIVLAVAVTDDDGDTGSDTIEIIASANEAPSVDAGVNQTVDEQTAVFLSANAEDADGTVTSYLWAQTAGTAVDMNSTDTANIRFSTPDLTADEVLTFKLTVTDDDGDASTDTLEIEVIANIPPAVAAGDAQRVDEKTPVYLSAVATDVDGTVKSYRWVQSSGSPVVLSAADEASVSFTAPDVDIEELLTFAVTSTDNDGDTHTDTVEITVIPNAWPTVSAGDDQTVDEKTSVTLAASADDSDGTVASYYWEQTSGTPVTLDSASQASASFSAPDINASESLTFSITVTDNDGDTVTDYVEVHVIANKAPTVDAGLDKELFESNEVLLTAHAEDEDGSVVSYYWQQTSGPSVELSSTDAAEIYFTAPTIDSEEAVLLSFSVSVTDDDGDLATDIIEILVQPSVPPTVNAGNNQIAFEERLVQLSASSAEGKANIANYSWQQTAGTTVELNSANSDVVNFLAPLVDSEETLTFEVSVMNYDGDTATDTVEVTVINEIPVTRKLNDTGVTRCGDYAEKTSGIDNNDVDCALDFEVDNGMDPVPFGQDGHYGRDADPTTNSDDNGQAGFDFTKLHAVGGGNLAANEAHWGCVRDNVTGLIWETKAQSGLRAAGHTYTWYDSSVADSNYTGVADTGIGTTDKGVAGSDDCYDGARCDTEKYVEDVNAMAEPLCGYSDWRLPSFGELMSLVDFSDHRNFIDVNYFPRNRRSHYFSSMLIAEDSDDIWTLDFSDVDNWDVYGVDEASYIRLVRGQ